jgi:hypothetical protein
MVVGLELGGCTHSDVILDPPGSPTPTDTLTFTAADGVTLPGAAGVFISQLQFRDGTMGGGLGMAFGPWNGRNWQGDIGVSLDALRAGEATITLRTEGAGANAGSLSGGNSHGDFSKLTHSGVMHLRFKPGRHLEGDIDCDVPEFNGTFTGTVGLECSTVTYGYVVGRNEVPTDGGLPRHINPDPNFESEFCRPFKSLR